MTSRWYRPDTITEVKVRLRMHVFIAQVLGAMERLLPSSCPHSLSLCLYGLAQLRCVPGEAWMDAWMAAATQGMGGANSRDLAGMLWALAKLRWVDQHNVASLLTTLPNTSACHQCGPLRGRFGL